MKPDNSQELKLHPALVVQGISVLPGYMSDYRAKISANTLTLKPETFVYNI